ncbi:hypothetical protein RN001_004200 [Aquatica leii]|uniref:Uncharacterized protein n=1 Tax=Aquatica leii TaxID=1421715 RepID=A0AAN7PI17_9COLE|nr:hypothetical protein RN001_004200 [Aquatica leii]
MELNAGLLSLQSALRNLEKSTQPFAKIKYKGGNEESISEIIDIIKLHLKHHEENTYKKDFLLVLILNTNLENNNLINVKEYQHLINLIPLLSTCLLANILVELDFLNAYSAIINTISIQENKEILCELEICLKQSEMCKTLKDTYVVLNAVINYFTFVGQNNETLERIADVFNEMLENLAKFNPDKVQSWTFVRLQEHIGYTLLHILKLLNHCPISLERLINSLINSTITIMKAVTLNVFCVWAEVQYEDGTPLQLIIAGEAFVSIEHLQKFKPGLTLVQMLSTIAKKPKTLTEKIQEADIETIINNVNRNKEDQIQWFRALVNTNVFDSNDAIKCLDKWYQLCTPDDVCRLLHLSAPSSDKTLALKCAFALNIDDLKSVIVKYFWKYPNDWNVDINNDLTLLFNKIQNNDQIEQNLLKKIYLLLIQNRKMFLRSLYTNCFNASANVKHFKNIFSYIKNIIEVNNVAKNTFIEVFQEHFVNDINVVASKELINALVELAYFTHVVVIRDIFQPQLKKLYENSAFTSMLSTLRVLNVVSINFVLDNETCPFISFLFEVAEKYRKPYALFVHHHVVQECVSLILKFEENGPYPQFKDELNALQLSPINRFYTRKLCERDNDKLLKYLFNSWNLNEQAECIAALIKVLPISVKSEWVLIASELDFDDDYESTLSIFNNVLFLLSQVTSSQENGEESENLVDFCLQQYLIVIKEFLQPKHNSLIEEKVLAKHICALLKDLPSSVRQNEFTRLIGLLSNDALKSLKDDREFILSLIAIQDIHVSQFLAQRILS